MPEPQIGQPTYQQMTVSFPIMLQFRLQDITTNLDRFVAEFQDLSDPERAALATNVANAINVVYTLIQPIAKARKIDIDRAMQEAVRPFAGKDGWPSVYVKLQASLRALVEALDQLKLLLVEGLAEPDTLDELVAAVVESAEDQHAE